MMRSTLPSGPFIAIFFLLLVLSGCAVGPDFKEPEFDVPESYRTDILPADSTGELVWWELFDDPMLVELVNGALQNNRSIKIAASRISQTEAAYGFTRADQFPRIDISGAAQTGNYFGGSRSDDTITGFSLTAPLTWELDFWGRYQRGVESADAAFF